MHKLEWVVGIDEVGRGPLAGPVMVCGVLMPISFYKKAKWKGLTDSKQMTEKARNAWFAEAHELAKNGKLYFYVAKRSASAIDRKGISVCISECIEEVVSKLIPSDRRNRVSILLDGSLKAPIDFPNQQTIIKGDAKHKIISLASVIAKVTRDAYMNRQHKKYPNYNWIENKGYGTKLHRNTLIKQGISPLHRKTFLTRIIDK